MRRQDWMMPLLAVLLAGSLLLSGYSTMPAWSGPETPYKIGLSAGLSGPQAGPGIVFRNEVVLEVERINAAGGIRGRPIELIIEDDGFDPTRIATVLTKLIRQDRVLAVLGPFGSFFEPVAKPITEREQVPQIAPAPTFAEMRARKFRWSFNIAPNEFIGAAGILETLKWKGYKKVVVIAEASALYQAILESLKADALREGIQVVVLPDTVAFRDIDVTPQVIKLRDLAARERAEAIVAVMTFPPGVLFLRATKQLLITLPIVGSHAWAFPQLLALAGGDLEGVRLPGTKYLAPEGLPNTDPQKAVILDFNRRYQAKFGAGQVPSGLGADAVNILAAALWAGGPDRARIRDAIERTSNFVGITGVFNYSPDDHEGLTKGAMAIYEVINGRFVLWRTLK